MARRESIEIPGLSHLTAIPVATKIGPLLVSSVIAPFKPGTREHSPDVGEQLEQIFAHVDSMLRAAGASWEHVAKMNFWLPDAASRPALEPVWLKYFPDEKSRPSRHTHISKDAPLATGDFLAYVGD